MNTQQQSNQGQPIQPIQISNHHLSQQQTINQNISQQNLSQQQQLQPVQHYSQHAHRPIQSYGQYNQNSDNNNNMMMAQTLPHQLFYNSFTSSPTIYDNLNLNITSSNIHHGINGNDPLISRISDRLLMIKDSIMTMNQQYAELEQDFIRLRRRYDQ
nr:1116_t:CDS:1 [Entrophospora candida]